MADATGSERTERLEQELAQVREQRDRLAAQLGGEDPEDADRGDRGDEAVELEGTVVTLRFPDGDVATYRIVAIPEENGDDVVTAGSPLGQALVGRAVGDTISYRGPDGDLRAEVVALSAP